MVEGKSGLNVWLNGEHVAVWSVVRGEHGFSYNSHWVASKDARPSSEPLPVRNLHAH